MKSICGNERGMVLAVTLVLLAIAILFGTTAFVVTSTGIKLTGNYKSGVQAHYAAEAGTEEARARLKFDPNNPNDPNRIDDSAPTSTAWRVFIGSLSNAQAKGFDSTGLMQVRKDSIQTALNYTVVIRHQTDSAENILYWGDDNGDGVNTRNTAKGENIYVVTSYNSTGSANKIVEIECTKLPSMDTGAPLYVEAQTTIQGNSTNIIGTGGGNCGGPVSAIRSPLGTGSVTLKGGPTVIGAGPSPSIAYNGANMDVQSIVTDLKGFANYAYTVNSATNTGMNWGTPTLGATLQDPSSCGVSNIVYYNTGGTYIKLAGGSHGCGILLVDGDLSINGGFSWYGIIISTGSITFTGGGNKQVTGEMIAGGSTDADLMGGNANIVYCGQAIRNQTQYRPLLLLTWKEVM